jgi:murein L,D-transpeptidase YcbB/YkuD
LADLDQYLSLQQRLLVELRKPIGLKVRYFTCEVLNGAMIFYEDVYKQDSLMIQALSSNAPLSETKRLSANNDQLW